MPILIRIVVQRLLAGMIALLAFFGLEPDIHINMDQTGPIVITDKSEEVSTLFADKEKTNEFDIRSVATTTNEISPAKVARIPLPQKNILEELRKREQDRVTNITQKEDTKTRQPVFAPVQTKTTPNIPEQSITLPQPEVEIDIPIKETIDQDDVDAFEKALQEELEKIREAEKLAQEQEVVVPEPEPTPDISEERTIDNSVVNIQCVRRNGNEIKLSTGSGVIISPNGVVMTNAHVAQYFLLEDLGYKCSLYRENTSLYGFTAKPLYISEDWISNNFMLISHPAPTGTGEDDYALLAITGSTIPSVSLPSSFSYLSANTIGQGADIGDSVTAAGYPGKSTGSFELDSRLSLVTDRTRITNVYTFGRSSIDVIATDDTPVARQGSSGGGIFRDNRLVGIIATTNLGSTPGSARINAITTSYINRDVENQTSRNLSEYTGGNLTNLAQSFQSSVAPRLTELLLQNL